MNTPHQEATPSTQGRALRKNVPLYGGREYGDWVDEPDETGGIAVRLRVTTQAPVERLGRERPDEPEPEIPDSQLHHRQEVNKTFAAVGQIGGSLLWYVVGCGEDLETWCWRMSQSYKNHAWGGRCGLAGHVSTARANLCHALDVLADAWGY